VEKYRAAAVILTGLTTTDSKSTATPTLDRQKKQTGDIGRSKDGPVITQTIIKTKEVDRQTSSGAVLGNRAVPGSEGLDKGRSSPQGKRKAGTQVQEKERDKKMASCSEMKKGPKHGAGKGGIVGPVELRGADPKIGVRDDKAEKSCKGDKKTIAGDSNKETKNDTQVIGQIVEGEETKKKEGPTESDRERDTTEAGNKAIAGSDKVASRDPFGKDSKQSKKKEDPKESEKEIDIMEREGPGKRIESNEKEVLSEKEEDSKQEQKCCTKETGQKATGQGRLERKESEKKEDSKEAKKVDLKVAEKKETEEEKRPEPTGIGKKDDAKSQKKPETKESEKKRDGKEEMKPHLNQSDKREDAKRQEKPEAMKSEKKQDAKDSPRRQDSKGEMEKESKGKDSPKRQDSKGNEKDKALKVSPEKQDLKKSEKDKVPKDSPKKQEAKGTEKGKGPKETTKRQDSKSNEKETIPKDSPKKQDSRGSEKGKDTRDGPNRLDSKDGVKRQDSRDSPRRDTKDGLKKRDSMHSPKRNDSRSGENDKNGPSSEKKRDPKGGDKDKVLVESVQRQGSEKGSGQKEATREPEKRGDTRESLKEKSNKDIEKEKDTKEVEKKAEHEVQYDIPEGRDKTPGKGAQKKLDVEVTKEDSKGRDLQIDSLISELLTAAQKTVHEEKSVRTAVVDVKEDKLIPSSAETSAKPDTGTEKIVTGSTSLSTVTTTVTEVKPQKVETLTETTEPNIGQRREPQLITAKVKTDEPRTGSKTQKNEQNVEIKTRAPDQMSDEDFTEPTILQKQVSVEVTKSFIDVEQAHSTSLLSTDSVAPKPGCKPSGKPLSETDFTAVASQGKAEISQEKAGIQRKSGPELEIVTSTGNIEGIQSRTEPTTISSMEQGKPSEPTPAAKHQLAGNDEKRLDDPNTSARKSQTIVVEATYTSGTVEALKGTPADVAVGMTEKSLPRQMKGIVKSEDKYPKPEGTFDTPQENAHVKTTAIETRVPTTVAPSVEAPVGQGTGKGTENIVSRPTSASTITTHTVGIKPQIDGKISETILKQEEIPAKVERKPTKSDERNSNFDVKARKVDDKPTITGGESAKSGEKTAKPDEKLPLRTAGEDIQILKGSSKEKKDDEIKTHTLMSGIPEAILATTSLLESERLHLTQPVKTTPVNSTTEALSKETHQFPIAAVIGGAQADATLPRPNGTSVPAETARKLITSENGESILTSTTVSKLTSAQSSDSSFTEKGMPAQTTKTTTVITKTTSTKETPVSAIPESSHQIVGDRFTVVSLPAEVSQAFASLGDPTSQPSTTSVTKVTSVQSPEISFFEKRSPIQTAKVTTSTITKTIGVSEESRDMDQKSSDPFGVVSFPAESSSGAPTSLEAQVGQMSRTTITQVSSVKGPQVSFTGTSTSFQIVDAPNTTVTKTTGTTEKPESSSSGNFDQKTGDHSVVVSFPAEVSEAPTSVGETISEIVETKSGSGGHSEQVITTTVRKMPPTKEGSIEQAVTITEKTIVLGSPGMSRLSSSDQMSESGSFLDEDFLKNTPKVSVKETVTVTTFKRASPAKSSVIDVSEDVSTSQSKTKEVSYVTTPTLARRTQSQRRSREERTFPVDVTNTRIDDSSDEDTPYTVTEPVDEKIEDRYRINSSPEILSVTSHSTSATPPKTTHKLSPEHHKVKFQLGSMDSQDSSPDVPLEPVPSNFQDERTSREDELAILADLASSALKSQDPVSVTTTQVREGPQSTKTITQTTTVSAGSSNSKEGSQERDVSREEKKLRRVERHFERMASQTLQGDTLPLEERDADFQRMVSQLSTEEMAGSQEQYLQLLDEGGASPDWDSRDPDTDDSPEGTQLECCCFCQRGVCAFRTKHALRLISYQHVPSGSKRRHDPTHPTLCVISACQPRTLLSVLDVSFPIFSHRNSQKNSPPCAKIDKFCRLLLRSYGCSESSLLLVSRGVGSHKCFVKRVAKALSIHASKYCTYCSCS